MAGHRFDHEAFPTETYAWSWGGIWAAPGGASIRDRLHPVTCLLLWARSRGATGETDLGTESIRQGCPMVSFHSLSRLPRRVISLVASAVMVLAVVPAVTLLTAT